MKRRGLFFTIVFLVPVIFGGVSAVAFDTFDGELWIRSTDEWRVGFASGYLSAENILGQPGGSTVVNAIEGKMHGFFATDEDYEKVRSWIVGGAPISNIESVEPIFEESCTKCHANAIEVANIVSQTYGEILPGLAASQILTIDGFIGFISAFYSVKENRRVPLVFVASILFELRAAGNSR